MIKLFEDIFAAQPVISYESADLLPVDKYQNSSDFSFSVKIS